MANQANPLSSFEHLIINHGPVQTSILNNLTRWEIRNLQLAGIGLPVSRTFLRKHHIPTRCDEPDPEKLDKRGPQRCTNKQCFEKECVDKLCANTTETFDEIRACAGRPLRVCAPPPLESWEMSPTAYVIAGSHPAARCSLLAGYDRDRYEGNGLLIKESLAPQEFQPCALHPPFWDSDDNNPVAPNRRRYPIHFKACRRCRDFYAAERLQLELRTIPRFHMPLCKQHSLEEANQLVLNACRCFGFINDKWRCRDCYTDTLSFLAYRASHNKKNRNIETPWVRPKAYLKEEWSPGKMRCPIEGCKRKPCDATGDGMKMCMGCDTISRI